MPSKVVDHPIVKQELDDLLKGTLDGNSETLTGSGALSLGCSLSIINTASGSAVALTLAAGTEGQRKYVVVDGKGAGSITLTPATCRGGTTITFAAVNSFCELMYLAGKWTVIGGQAAA